MGQESDSLSRLHLQLHIVPSGDFLRICWFQLCCGSRWWFWGCTCSCSSVWECFCGGFCGAYLIERSVGWWENGRITFVCTFLLYSGLNLALFLYLTVSTWLGCFLMCSHARQVINTCSLFCWVLLGMTLYMYIWPHWSTPYQEMFLIDACWLVGDLISFGHTVQWDVFCFIVWIVFTSF